MKTTPVTVNYLIMLLIVLDIFIKLKIYLFVVVRKKRIQFDILFYNSVVFISIDLSFNVLS